VGGGGGRRKRGGDERWADGGWHCRASLWMFGERMITILSRPIFFFSRGDEQYERGQSGIAE
jgi:hypothetical protein